MPSEIDRLLSNLALKQVPEITTVIKKGVPIFPRLDTEEEIKLIQEAMSGKGNNESTGKVDDEDWNPESVELVYHETESVEFTDFIKTEMKVAEVIDVAPVDGSNKLLRFRLDAGDKGHRQILSGIAKYYPDHEALIGKKVIVVANLKPRKMMGYISQGMILSSESDGKLTLLFADPEAANGSLIG